MAFATAGTGATISTLSGAAATNATLAWLGGGTLASGGMGIAGGMMALGALTTGPALLIAGWYMGSKAESNLMMLIAILKRQENSLRIQMRQLL